MLADNDDIQNITHMFEGKYAMPKISIPREVLRPHTRPGLGAQGWRRRVRMASLLFRNMSRLLPNSLDDGAQNDTLVKVNIKFCPRFIPTLNQSCDIIPGSWPGNKASC